MSRIDVDQRRNGTNAVEISPVPTKAPCEGSDTSTHSMKTFANKKRRYTTVTPSPEEAPQLNEGPTTRRNE